MTYPVCVSGSSADQELLKYDHIQKRNRILQHMYKEALHARTHTIICAYADFDRFIHRNIHTYFLGLHTGFIYGYTYTYLGIMYQINGVMYQIN